jgi:hypothetical protein
VVKKVASGDLDPDTKTPFATEGNDENIMVERMLGLIKSKKAKRAGDSSNSLARYFKPKRVFPPRENTEAPKLLLSSQDNQYLKEERLQEEQKLHNKDNGLITNFFASKRFCTEVSSESSDKLISISQPIGAIELSHELPQSTEQVSAVESTDQNANGIKTEAIKEEQKISAIAEVSKAGGLLSVKDITLANFGYTAPPKAGIKARRSTQKTAS